MRQAWLLCNALGGGRARALALQAQQRAGRGLVPWAGVAAPLPLPPGHAYDEAAAGKAETAEGGNSIQSKDGSSSRLDGQAFCFLPLPCSTGGGFHLPTCWHSFFGCPLYALPTPAQTLGAIMQFTFCCHHSKLLHA